MQQRLRSPHDRRWRECVLAGVAALLSGAGAAAAADAPADAPVFLAPQDAASPITDRFYFDAIYFPAKVRTELRVDPDGMLNGGTQLSGERDLQWPGDNRMGLVELMFRLRERNRIRVDYLQLNRASNVLLDRTIIFGNETFNCSVTPCSFQSSLDWKTESFTYTYAFLQNEHFELGAGVGVHLEQGDLIGSAPALLEQHESTVSFGIPTVAVDGIWNISRRFAFTARAQYVRASLNGFTGSLGDYHGDFQYRWRRNFAIGVGYSYFRQSYVNTAHTNTGLLIMAIQGPQAFLRVSF
jgi:hypothetical protein